MSIVQLALAFRIGTANPILLNDITFVNAMISVFGVVFATVWAGKEHQREANMAPNLGSVAEREQRYTAWRVASHSPVGENFSCQNDNASSVKLSA